MTEEFKTNSFVHGYHLSCIPRYIVGEQLLCEREEGDPQDRYAVVIKKSGNIVGQVPHMQYFNGFLFIYKTTWCCFYEIIF